MLKKEDTWVLLKRFLWPDDESNGVEFKIARGDTWTSEIIVLWILGSSLRGCLFRTAWIIELDVGCESAKEHWELEWAIKILRLFFFFLRLLDFVNVNKTRVTIWVATYKVVYEPVSIIRVSGLSVKCVSNEKFLHESLWSSCVSQISSIPFHFHIPFTTFMATIWTLLRVAYYY